MNIWDLNLILIHSKQINIYLEKNTDYLISNNNKVNLINIIEIINMSVYK